MLGGHLAQVLSITWAQSQTFALRLTSGKCSTFMRLIRFYYALAEVLLPKPANFYPVKKFNIEVRYVVEQVTEVNPRHNLKFASERPRLRTNNISLAVEGLLRFQCRRRRHSAAEREKEA